MNILHLLSTDGFISVNKTLIKKVGLEAAVLIGEICSEFVYHSNKGYLTEDGYFFSTVKNIEEKTTIKEKRQRAILKELEEIGVIDTVKRGLPSKRYIKINQNNLLNLISIPNKNGQNGGTVTVNKAELIPSVEATNNNIINNKIINNKDIVPVKTDTIPYERIIDYLNRRVGSNFQWTAKENQSLIRARFKEGAKVEDFKTVIDKKWKQWHDNAKMVKYLRPKTLFSKGNFSEYLGEAELMQENKPKQQYQKKDAMSMMLEQLNFGGYDNDPVNEPRRDQLLISEDGSTL